MRLAARVRQARAPWRFALGIAALAAGVACGGAEPRGRVLLVGIDGASPRVVDRLLAEGELPHLAGLAAEGVYTTIRSFPPYASPRIWNTIATGKVPEKHGILSFAREGSDGAQRLYLSTDRRAHALWNIASNAGLSVGVVNWWNTYPVDRVDGVIISDHATQGEIDRRLKMTRSQAIDAGPVVFPAAWEPRALELLAADGQLTAFADPFAANEALPRWVNRKTLSWVFATDSAAVRAALAIEAELEPDLLMVFLPGIDRTSHWLWGGIEPQSLYPEGVRLSPEQQAAEARALLDYYRYSDALIGLLLARYTKDDLALVVSDHGFEAGSALGFLTGVHDSPAAEDGVLFVRGRGVRRGTPAEGPTVNDVTPTLLAWLGLPVADDMDGRRLPFAAPEPAARVPTYDTEPIARLGEAPSGAEDAILEQLRSLGYLED